MAQRKQGRPKGSGRTQQLILSVFAEEPDFPLIPQNELHRMARRIASDRFENGEDSKVRMPHRQGTGRALKKLEEQDEVLVFKTWFPHPFTVEKKLRSWVTLPDREIFGVPARVVAEMLEIRNDGHHIPWSNEWLQTQFYEWSYNPALGKGIYIDRRKIKRSLAVFNDIVLDMLDVDPEDKYKDGYEIELWVKVATWAIIEGGILKLGEKLFLADWRRNAMASVAAPDDVNKGFAITGTYKELPETSSPRPAEVVLPADDEGENGFTRLDQRVADLQKRITEAG